MASTAGESHAKDDIKSLPMAELQKRLGASRDSLSETEAQERLAKYGPNEIQEKKTNEPLKFLTYYWGPIPWMIEVAVVLSAVARHWPDFGIILVLLVSNAVVGFWEEHEAGNAIAALKATLAIKARVKRDGKWVTPPARDLVPGDVIRVRLGDIVPADARLLAGDPVEVDQSALTGESLPATRQPGEAVFSGSIIRQGESDALVYATATNTYFGKTAQLVQEAHKRIAVVYNKRGYSKGFADSFKDGINKRRVRETTYDVLNGDGSDVAALAHRLKALGINVVFYGGYAKDLIRLVHQCAELDFHPQIFTGEAASAADFWTTTGPAAEGVVFGTIATDPNYAGRAALDQTLPEAGLYGLSGYVWCGHRLRPGGAPGGIGSAEGGRCRLARQRIFHAVGKGAI